MTAKTKDFIIKLSLGAMGIVSTVSMSFAGFALKEGYKTRLIVNRLETKAIDTKEHISDLKETPVKIILLSEQVKSLNEDIKEIKCDIKEVKQLLRDGK